jgi:hypothetical protein
MNRHTRVAFFAVPTSTSFSLLYLLAASALAQPAEPPQKPPRPAAPGPADEPPQEPSPPDAEPEGAADEPAVPAGDIGPAEAAPEPGESTPAEKSRETPAREMPPDQGKQEPSGPAEPADAPPLPEPTAPADRSDAAGPWSMIEPGTLWYLHYTGGRGEAKARVNRVSISRGYVTLKFKPVQWFHPRVTLDTHQNEEGDWMVRLKYLYGNFRVPVETEVLTEPHLEVGLVHIPWLDFEEHVNNYRAQGTMLIERNSILNSADLGVTAGGLLGRKLPGEYRNQVSHKYPGTWGSFALGMYNGGGYHAAEENRNKVFMGRLTVRPLGPVLPNLQLSYFNVTGQGNTADSPDWLLNQGLASFEHQYFVLTAQIAAGEGNQKGDKIDAVGESLDLFGWSVFAELKLPWILSSLIGRYDWFDWDTSGGDPGKSRVIAGYAFHFLPHNFLLASLDWVGYDDSARPAETLWMLTLQIHVP